MLQIKIIITWKSPDKSAIEEAVFIAEDKTIIIIKITRIIIIIIIITWKSPDKSAIEEAVLIADFSKSSKSNSVCSTNNSVFSYKIKIILKLIIK